MKKTVFRLVEALIVGAALVVLTVRTTQSDAFGEYRRRGGRKDFWSWFAKEKCGVSLPGVEDLDEKFAAEEKKAKAGAEREKHTMLAIPDCPMPVSRSGEGIFPNRRPSPTSCLASDR